MMPRRIKLIKCEHFRLKLPNLSETEEGKEKKIVEPFLNFSQDHQSPQSTSCFLSKLIAKFFLSEET